MQTTLRRLVLPFVTAVAVAAVLASLCSTQFVLAGLAGVGIDIPLSTRLAMTVDDLAILMALLPAIAASWLIAFPIAARCAQKLGGHRAAWYAAAGGIALIVELMIIKVVLGVTIIAGARSMAGLACHGLSGAVGGYLFARLSSPGNATENHHA